MIQELAAPRLAWISYVLFFLLFDWTPSCQLNMGHGNSNKLYVTHAEHASGDHTASSYGKRAEQGKSGILRLPL